MESTTEQRMQIPVFCIGIYTCEFSGICQQNAVNSKSWWYWGCHSTLFQMHIFLLNLYHRMTWQLGLLPNQKKKYIYSSDSITTKPKVMSPLETLDAFFLLESRQHPASEPQGWYWNFQKHLESNHRNNSNKPKPQRAVTEATEAHWSQHPLIITAFLHSHSFHHTCHLQHNTSKTAGLSAHTLESWGLLQLC